MSKINILLFFLILTGCQEYNSKVKPIVFKDEIFVTGTAVIRDKLIDYSYLLEQYGNYLIFLNFRNNGVVKILDKNSGEIIYDGVRFGDGPNEILIPISIYVDQITSKVYIQDGGTNSIKFICFDNIIDESADFETINLPSTGDRIFPVFPTGNNFLGITLDKNKEIFEFNNKGISDTLVKFEKSKIQLPDNIYGIPFEGKYGISRNKKFILKGELYNSRITLFDLKSRSSQIFESNASDVFKDSFDEKLGRYELDPLRIYHYASVKEYDNKFFLLYSGIGIKENEVVLKGNEIHVLDLNDYSFRKIILDKYITDFVFDSDKNVIYGLNFTDMNPVYKFYIN
jgi:hypothetical protein